MVRAGLGASISFTVVVKVSVVEAKKKAGESEDELSVRAQATL